MATDMIISLERLRCVREIDAAGHSEPYIWPVLLWIDDDTLTTPELVGVTAPVLGNARIVIKDNMRAGETAIIPSSVGLLRVRLEDSFTVRRLLLSVVLWEEDETPEAAMKAGYQAFAAELRAAVADNLLALSQASEEEMDALVDEIEDRVDARVRSAIKNGLTAWQKTRVFVGTLNLDDVVDSDYCSFDNPGPQSIRLIFGAGTANDYEIEGLLQVRRVPIDLCRAQVDAVKAAQAVVDAIEAEIAGLQAELHGGGGSGEPTLPKAYILAEIRRLREEELPGAMAALEEARRALQACRDRWRRFAENVIVADAAGAKL